MCFCFAMSIHLNWFFLFVCFWPQSKRDLSSPDQESNLWPCSGSAGTHSLSHRKTREVPRLSLFQKWKTQSFLAVVQPLSCVRLFVIPSMAARQASLSFTISQSLLKLMSIELVMPSNHLIICCPLLLLPLNARKNVGKGSVPEIEPWPVISMEEHGRGVVGEPGRASRLESPLCPASTYLPNICFSVHSLPPHWSP